MTRTSTWAGARALLAATLLALPAFSGCGDPEAEPGFAPEPAPGAPVEQRLTKLSFDPYSNPDGQHETAMETHVVSEGDVLVSAFMVGRLREGGVTNIGWASSRNRGATWESGMLDGTTVYANGPYESVFDPVVAYSRRHRTWMIALAAELPNDGGRRVLVSLSTNDGRSWGPLVEVARGTALDKNWITCDNAPASPHYGNCYMEYDENDQDNLILTSRSTDGGRTWEPGRTTADRAAGISGQPVTLPNGRVVVPILGPTFEKIFSYYSDDGGASWSSSVDITDTEYIGTRAGLRMAPNPSATVDASGRIYLVWPDCRLRPACTANDILLMTSTDGVEWSTPVRINAEPFSSGQSHLFPGIGWDPSGGSGDQARLGVVYYTVSPSNQVTAHYTRSLDGGRTWSAPSQLAGPMQTSWISTTPRGTLIGDYTALAFSGGLAFPVFSVAMAPAGREYNQGVYTFPQP